MKDKLQSYEECRKRYKLGELTSQKAAELCGMPQSTFVNWVKRDERQDPNEMVQVVQLCALRSERGLSVRELAQLSGVGESTIYAYEQGRRRVGRKSSIAICKTLGVDDMVDLNELVEVPRHIFHFHNKQIRNK